jgi:AcrR family transcriptional regulator
MRLSPPDRDEPASDAAAEPRRTEGVRCGGRSARVVDAVLLATVEELGTVGYSALRVEDVASRSGVNKTSIYRRWPTKVDLVAAALANHSRAVEIPDTGSFRGDLLEVGRMMVRKVGTPLGRGLIRMSQMERGHPELDSVIRQVRAQHICARGIIVERAIARGEVPADTDPLMVSELVSAPISSRLLHHGVDVDERFIERVVDTVIAGARAGAFRKEPGDIPGTA